MRILIEDKKMHLSIILNDEQRTDWAFRLLNDLDITIVIKDEKKTDE